MQIKETRKNAMAEENRGKLSGLKSKGKQKSKYLPQVPLKDFLNKYSLKNSRHKSKRSTEGYPLQRKKA